MTLRRLLCPIDFSDVSSHALDHAVSLARESGARLTVLHVFHPLVPRTGLASLDAATAQVTSPAHLQELRDLVAAACRPADDAGVGVDIAVAGGHPAETILEHATAVAADLVVMGTHGAGGFQHLVLGSVAEKVLRKAACPVLTVPPRAAATRAGTFTSVVCAVDFSDCSLAAVAAAAALTRSSAARLTLLHVLEWPWHEPPVPGIESLPAAQAVALLEYRRYLETSAAERLAGLAASGVPGRDVKTAVQYGKPYAELLAAAHETGADLIVLGVRGRSALDLGFFGSTANQVVRRATCPVLTVRA